MELILFHRVLEKNIVIKFENLNEMGGRGGISEKKICGHLKK